MSGHEAKKLERVRRREWRLIGRQRARTLRRRGETVFWDRDLASRVWVPRKK